MFRIQKSRNTANTDCLYAACLYPYPRVYDTPCINGRKLRKFHFLRWIRVYLLQYATLSFDNGVLLAKLRLARPILGVDIPIYRLF